MLKMCHAKTLLQIYGNFIFLRKLPWTPSGSAGMTGEELERHA